MNDQAVYQNALSKLLGHPVAGMGTMEAQSPKDPVANYHNNLSQMLATQGAGEVVPLWMQQSLAGSQAAMDAGTGRAAVNYGNALIGSMSNPGMGSSAALSGANYALGAGGSRAAIQRGNVLGNMLVGGQLYPASTV